MAGTPISMEKEKQIKIMSEQGIGKKTIARNLSISKNTVKEYLKKFANPSGAIVKESSELTEPEEIPSDTRMDILKGYFPDMDTKLEKPGFTRSILWEQYRRENPSGYSYSQFCYHYGQYSKVKDVVMHFDHKYGDKLFIDYSGKKVHYVEKETGEIIECEFFLCVLGGSQHTYAQASHSQQKADFIHSVENALHYYGGVPKVLIPDNLKSAVTKSNHYDPTLNDDFLAMATHYNTAAMPARALRPRDKALVERYVSILYTRIFTKLSNQTFFSLTELNKAIRVYLEEHNDMLFQGREYSRRMLFEKYEKQELSPLPSTRYEIKEYTVVKVMKNSHILYGKDKHYYSVPYSYIGKNVKISAGISSIEIYHSGERIAIHGRNRKPFKYSTIKEHIPSTHQYVSDWSPEKFISMAGKIDPAVKEYITGLFETKAYPEQLYRSCSGIIQFSGRVGKERLVAACKLGIEYGCYNYSFIHRVLQNNTENMKISSPEPVSNNDHANIRGGEYYKSQLTESEGNTNNITKS